jgi:plasmid segregation protein ParM
MKTMSADKPVYYVAIDDGFAAMKLIGERPDGSVQYMEFPSIIRSGSDRAMASVFGDNNRIGYYQTEEGIFFTVSKDIVGDGTRIPDFHISQMNRVLVNHALMAAGYGGLDVVVMVGLPVSEFYKDGKRDKVRTSAKTANLLKKVTAVTGRETAMPHILDAKVGCQALAAYFDLLYDIEGHPLDQVDSVAVVDIGGSTTDITVVMDGQIDESKTNSIKTGVLDVHELIQQKLKNRGISIDGGFPVKVMDRAIREGKIKQHGEDVDISQEVNSAIVEITYRLKQSIQLRLGDTSLLDKVFFVGGGPSVFKDIASDWKNAIVPEYPSFSNARGLLKYYRNTILYPDA